MQWLTVLYPPLPPAPHGDKLRLAFLRCRDEEKLCVLLLLLREVIPTEQQAMIFVATRQHCEFVQAVLVAAGIKALCVYGSMHQEARTVSLLDSFFAFALCFPLLVFLPLACSVPAVDEGVQAQTDTHTPNIFANK